MVVDVTNNNGLEIYNENVIKDAAKKIITVKELWDQYKPHTKTFVKHKWIHRYINEKQKAALEKHYEVLKADNTNYSSYKRSFAAVAKFMGLPVDSIVLENIEFGKDSKDKDQDIVSVKYSKGRVKIQIPDGITLKHVHNASTEFTGDSLIPSFRSRVKGKYMYPNKRIFFTCIKDISASKSGFEGEKKFIKMTPKEKIKYAYIDPACSDFRDNAVYIETDSPIPINMIK